MRKMLGYQFFRQNLGASIELYATIHPTALTAPLTSMDTAGLTLFYP
jgi:hypothetical protein